MNIEELKLILDTIKDVAQTSGYAGVTWIAVHYLVMLAQAVAVPICVCVMLVKITRAATNAWVQRKTEQNVMWLREAIDAREELDRQKEKK